MLHSLVLLLQISIFMPGKQRQVPFMSVAGKEAPLLKPLRGKMTEVKYENTENLSAST